MEAQDQNKSQVRQIREEYFRLRGLPCPAEPKERYKLALNFTEQIPVDFEGVIMLFDHIEDRNDADWLLLMGWSFDQHINNPHFDPATAHSFYLQAAQLGSSVASYNLGLNYETGNNAAVNLDAAAYWYEKAKHLSFVNARLQLAQLAIQHDARFEAPGFEQFTRNTYEQVLQADQEGSVQAKLEITKLVAAERHYKKDDAVVIQRYDTLAHIHSDINTLPTKVAAGLNMGLRSFLGFGTEYSLEKSSHYLGVIPDKAYNNWVSSTAIPKKEKILRKIQFYMGDAEKHGALSAVLDILRPAYDDPQQVKTILDAVEKGAPPYDRAPSIAMQDAVWAAHYLSAQENWKNKEDWANLRYAIVARQNGLSLEKIERATMIVGPRYNPHDKNGRPTLGVWEKPNQSFEEMQADFIKTGSYVPEAGIIKLNAIFAEQNGSISFDWDMKEDRPALLLAEDFEVALALVFGKPGRNAEGKPDILWPILSLESLHHKELQEYPGITDEHELLQYKYWSPKWLGHTDFGRTLFVTDTLIGDWAWNAKDFTIGDLAQTFHGAVPKMARDLVADIQATGGRVPLSSSKRVMLAPQHIATKSHVTQEANPFFSVEIKEAKMRVEGSYILKDDRIIALDDPLYAQGRVTKKLTDRFNDISAMMPVFERSRQLMSLLYGLAELRRLGYTPPPGWQTQISNKLAAYEHAGYAPLEDRICKHLPCRLER